MTEHNIFLSNAAKLRALNEAIYETLKHRKENPSAWEEACRRFHAEYDSLAFPGGLANAFLRLEAGDPPVIEEAVQFLEADPYYFRSGYHKVDIIKHLGRNPLSENQRRRLQQVVLKQIHDRDKREFRAYCRLAKAVADGAFYRQVSELAGPSRGTVPRRARWVLEHLDSSASSRPQNP